MQRQASLEPTHSLSNERRTSINYNWEQPLHTQASPIAQHQQAYSTPRDSFVHKNDQVEYRGQVMNGEADYTQRALDGR